MAIASDGSNPGPEPPSPAMIGAASVGRIVATAVGAVVAAASTTMTVPVICGWIVQ